MAENKDIFARTTGNFGKWQLRAVLIIFLCKIPTSWFMAVVIYTAPAPKVGDYWCRPVEPHQEKWKAVYHPATSQSTALSIDYCSVYKELHSDPDRYMEVLMRLNKSESLGKENNINNTIVTCEHFNFKSGFRSLVIEYELVCERKYLLSLAQCFHIFGLLLGGIAAYWLLKSYSPRRIMLVGMMSQICFGSLCGITQNFTLHVLFRCLTAITCALMYSSGQMILGDITGGRAKIIVITLFELFWSIGLILLPAITIFFSNWSNIYLSISLPTIGLVCLHRLIPDSPRWMIQKGRIDKAKSILQKSARVNERAVPTDIDLQLQMQAEACENAPTAPTLLQLWRDHPHKHSLLVIHYAWGIFILLLNSMVLNINSFGQEHIRMNTVVMALSEIAGVFVGLCIILYTKRKWLATGGMCIAAGLFANIAWIIPQTMNYTHIVALTMIPCIVIKITTSAAMAILTTCTADLISPEKRKVLMFSSAIWARTWFLWAPFLGTVSSYGMLVPLTIFAIMSVLGGGLFLIIDNFSKEKRTKVKMQHNVLEKETFLGK